MYKKHILFIQFIYAYPYFLVCPSPHPHSFHLYTPPLTSVNAPPPVFLYIPTPFPPYTPFNDVCPPIVSIWFSFISTQWYTLVFGPILKHIFGRPRPASVPDFYQFFFANIPCYLYQMLTQNMLRTHKGKQGFFSEIKSDLCLTSIYSYDLHSSNITEMAPYVHTHF